MLYITKPTGSDVNYWAGHHSVMKIGGDIEKYVIKCLKEIQSGNELHISFTISKNDGLENIDVYDEHMNKLEKTTLRIIGTLCTRYVERPNIIYLPLDDDIFKRGLKDVLSSITNPKWDERIPKAFWRGGTSGGFPSIRTNTVSLLFDYINADVKLTYGDWNINMPIENEHFEDRCGLDKHFKYKYILIIDGNLIASNHQWVFGSGAVPIMITHPDNNWWFKKMLKPMYNYVPVKYDLSDVKEKIEWLIENDDKAKIIMENAITLSNEILSHQGQCKYIESEIKRIIEI